MTEQKTIRQMIEQFIRDTIGEAKLIWDDTWDRNCPKCGGFAVERPAKPGEAQSQEWLAGEVDLFCINCGLMPQEGKEKC